jgi:hypothetical protein
MEMERTMQQMMELLLARMNASMKEQTQEMTARMYANQTEMNAKMDANHKKMMTMLDAHHERTMALSWEDGGHGFEGNPRENGICNEASGHLRGRRRSDAGRRTKEAA